MYGVSGKHATAIRWRFLFESRYIDQRENFLKVSGKKNRYKVINDLVSLENRPKVKFLQDKSFYLSYR